MQVALRLGLSYPPLAVAALDGARTPRRLTQKNEPVPAPSLTVPLARSNAPIALEYWIGQAGDTAVTGFADVLPSFYDYLTATADATFRYPPALVPTHPLARKRTRPHPPPRPR